MRAPPLGAWMDSSTPAESNWSIKQCNHSIPRLREKINFLGFLPKFYHNIIASQGFQIRNNFCDISDRFQVIVKTLVLRLFFNSAHF